MKAFKRMGNSTPGCVQVAVFVIMWQNMTGQRPSVGNIRLRRVETLAILALVRSDHQSKDKVYHVFISLSGRLSAADIPLAVGPRKV